MARACHRTPINLSIGDASARQLGSSHDRFTARFTQRSVVARCHAPARELTDVCGGTLSERTERHDRQDCPRRVASRRCTNVQAAMIHRRWPRERFHRNDYGTERVHSLEKYVLIIKVETYRFRRHIRVARFIVRRDRAFIYHREVACKLSTLFKKLLLLLGRKRRKKRNTCRD